MFQSVENRLADFEQSSQAVFRTAAGLPFIFFRTYEAMAVVLGLPEFQPRRRSRFDGGSEFRFLAGIHTSTIPVGPGERSKVFHS